MDAYEQQEGKVSERRKGGERVKDVDEGRRGRGRNEAGSGKK
jgi:hypothetical protein